MATQVRFEDVSSYDGSLCFRFGDGEAFRVKSLKEGIMVIDSSFFCTIDSLAKNVAGCFEKGSNFNGLKAIEFEFNGAYVSVTEKNANPARIVQLWNEKMKERMGSFLEDDAIESKMVTKSIENAQKRVEGQNFDIRKQLLQYDDVMRQQREIMYKERDDIMSQTDLGPIVKGMFEQAVENTVRQFTKHDDKKEKVDVDGALNYISKNYMLLATLAAKNKEVVEHDAKKLTNSLSEIVYLQYQNRFNKDLPAEIKLDYERRILLGVIDHTWINHIDAMQKLRNGIYLRAYAQRDPLQEYTEEAFYMFEEMTKSISQDITRNIVHMGIAPGSEQEKQIPSVQIELEFKAD